VPTSVTIPVGATATEARRLLALQTFASTSGDIEKTAKLLGIVADDVRRDLLSFVNEVPATLASAPPAANGTDETATNGRPKPDLPQERVLASVKKPLARKR
jgi:hypothetical protein